MVWFANTHRASFLSANARRVSVLPVNRVGVEIVDYRSSCVDDLAASHPGDLDPSMGRQHWFSSRESLGTGLLVMGGVLGSAVTPVADLVRACRRGAWIMLRIHAGDLSTCRRCFLRRDRHDGVGNPETTPPRPKTYDRSGSPPSLPSDRSPGVSENLVHIENVEVIGGAGHPCLTYAASKTPASVGRHNGCTAPYFDGRIHF